MTLYHYCSNQTFHQIITKATLRLSSMTLSNDAEEGGWTIRLLERLLKARAGNDPKTSLSQSQLETAVSNLAGVHADIDGLGTCFSEAGDMLSQWRGYADDGRGVSIGFDDDKLSAWAKRRAAGLFKVIYDADTAFIELADLADIIEKHARSGAFENSLAALFMISDRTIDERSAEHAKVLSANAAFTREAFNIVISHLYRFKNPAFEEEREWRVVQPFMRSFPGASFELHPTSSVLKPYRTEQIEDQSKGMITHVKLGPKNATPEGIVQSFLALNGFTNVVVSRSSATYR